MTILVSLYLWKGGSVPFTSAEFASAMIFRQNQGWKITTEVISIE
jgi:hypothetical protein